MPPESMSVYGNYSYSNHRELEDTFLPKTYKEPKYTSNDGKKNESTNLTVVADVAGATATGVGTAVALSAVPAALGFSATGITAGSTAAAIMASYGGSVTAGSMCAILQSAGVIGFGGPVLLGAGLIGAAIYGAVRLGQTINDESKQKALKAMDELANTYAYPDNERHPRER
ncbi:hypothetical protein WA158_000507 [Blastocystis sp. Blastoise]